MKKGLRHNDDACERAVRGSCVADDLYNTEEKLFRRCKDTNVFYSFFYIISFNELNSFFFNDSNNPNHSSGQNDRSARKYDI
uniref:Uncharacterized protein n=1 Tax=Lepeophtheirus salmonis TaxID=72036 RepID=A0A0K2V3U7_LEPSM